MIPVTLDDVESLITGEHYCSMGEKTTVCLISTSFGMEFVGSVHSQTKETYDYDIGKKLSKKKAIDNLWSCAIVYLRK